MMLSVFSFMLAVFLSRHGALADGIATSWNHSSLGKEEWMALDPVPGTPHFWPQFLNHILTNGPKTVQLMSPRVTMIDGKYEGQCVKQRKCMDQKVSPQYKAFSIKWKALHPEVQLRLIVAASLNDTRPASLAPVFMYWDDKEARTLIEQVMWLTGYDETHCAPDGNGWRPTPCVMDRSRWTPWMRHAKGHCGRCPINSSQWTWDSLHFDKRHRQIFYPTL